MLAADTDIIGHINGGHTALPDDQIVCLCEKCGRGLELVHNGNLRAALVALNTARELGQLDRIMLGTDAPAGSGVQPLGIIRTVAHAVLARQYRAGDRLLLRDRQYRAACAISIAA